jgi:pimeloyl-ACP methyl ester carboxylesterase
MTKFITHALLGLMPFISSVQVMAQSPNKMEMEKVSGYAPVNGLKMYYEIYGKGEMPLVLIHGGGSTIQSTFGTILPMLAMHHKVIAVELQAHGRTNDRNAPESFVQDADDVAGLLKYLKIDKANFLGFSNGGTTTLQIAIRHPEIVNKIIPVSCSYTREGMIAGFFEHMPHATLDTMPKPLQAAFLAVNPDQKDLQTMFEKDKQRMVSFKDIPDDLIKSIKAPALIIVGDHDVVTTDHAVKMSHVLQNAQLAILPGNHGSFIGEVCSIQKGSRFPEMTVVMVDEFLAKAD